MPPKLSIGLPVYNGERYLERAIESLLAQTFREFELIVSDNASTDGTADICTRMAARDTRIRIVRNEKNLGAVANFNRVFQLAHGEFFKWACADDLVAPTLLERALAVLDTRPDVVLCYPRTMLIDEHDTLLRAYADGLDLQAADVLERFGAACAHTGLLNVLQGVMRSSALSLTPLFQPFRGTDIALMVELSLHGKLVELDEPLLQRRMHAEAASASQTHAERQEHLDPESRGTLSTWWWRHSWEHAQAVRRAPLPTRVKLELWAHVARQCYWHRSLLMQEAGSAARHWLTPARKRR
ncbi:MAG: glycosyltransferase [Acidobacteriota bacterium]